MKHVKKRKEQLKFLYNIDKIIDSKRSFRAKTNAIMRKVMSMISADSCYAFLRADEEIKVNINSFDESVLKKMRSRYRQPRIINMGRKSFLRVPLNIANENFGFLLFLRKNYTFNVTDKILLRTIAKQMESLVMVRKEKEMIKSIFKHYLAEHLVEELIEKEKHRLMKKRATVSILFADIRGFTLLCKNNKPVTVFRMLDEYLSVMSEIIMKHGGMVDKFIGDEIMGVFGAPYADRHHAVSVVECALDMIRKMKELKKKWNRKFISMGIGISSGHVITGTLGRERISYEVIGNAVNIAAKIEKRNEKGILIGENTYRLVKDRFCTKKVKPTKINERERIETYKVCS